MNDDDHIAAKKALKSWFASQDIEPPDAGVVMLMLPAELLVEKTRDVKELSKAIKILTEGLTIEVAGRLR